MSHAGKVAARSTWMPRLGRRALLGASLVVGGAALAGASWPSAGQPAASRWTPAAVARLRKLQEDAYRRIAQRLGVGTDPMATYTRLFEGRMPLDRIGSKAFEETFHVPAGRPTDRGSAAEGIEQYARRWANASLPTPYEDPNLYGVMLEMGDAIERVAQTAKVPIPRSLLLGTVPTGNVNASTLLASDGTHLVVFQFGLFLFAYQMAVIAAVALPPLVTLDARGNPQLGTGPLAPLEAHPEAAKQLFRVLYAFVVLGDPRAVERLPLNTPQKVSASALLRAMELFVLAHEYGHVAMRHVENGKAFRTSETEWVRWSQQAEYDADELGLDFAIGVQSMEQLPLTVAGIELAFSCIEVIERCLLALTGRPAPDAASADHPPTPLRREALRRLLRELRPGPDTERTIRIGVRIETLFTTSWHSIESDWKALSDRGVRPAAIWT